MQSFASVNLRGTSTHREGWQRHHLIPRQCLENDGLAMFWRDIQRCGFRIDDFETNGLLLPALPSIAEIHGLPVHSGPHPVYNGHMLTTITLVARQALLHDSIWAIGQLRDIQAQLRAKLGTRRSNRRAQTVDDLCIDGRTDTDITIAVSRQIARDRCHSTRETWLPTSVTARPVRI